MMNYFFVYELQAAFKLGRRTKVDCGSSSANAIDRIRRDLMWQGSKYTGWLGRDLGQSGNGRGETMNDEEG